MIGEIELDFGVILAVFLGMLLFGIGYNAFVAWLERRGYTEGYMSLIVAFGVAMTLMGTAILSIQAALLTLCGFIATGSPMIVGSIVRYIQVRDRVKRDIKSEINERLKRYANDD